MLTRLIEVLLYPEYANRDKSQDITAPDYDITDRGAVILHEDALQKRLAKAHEETEAIWPRREIVNHQRQQFEAWASAPPMEFRLRRHGEHSAWPGQYREYHAQCAWEAWQAATAAAWEEMIYALRSHRCGCQGVDPGSYDNQVELPRPPHMPASEGAAPTICVDTCLAEEIQALWQQGITTTGCCCGHNRLPGFIGVIDDDIPRMLAMGYRVAHNTMRPGDDDSFYPKSTWRES